MHAYYAVVMYRSILQYGTVLTRYHSWGIDSRHKVSLITNSWSLVWAAQSSFRALVRWGSYGNGFSSSAPCRRNRSWSMEVVSLWKRRMEWGCVSIRVTPKWKGFFGRKLKQISIFTTSHNLHNIHNAVLLFTSRFQSLEQQTLKFGKMLRLESVHHLNVFGCQLEGRLLEACQTRWGFIWD